MHGFRGRFLVGLVLPPWLVASETTARDTLDKLGLSTSKVTSSTHSIHGILVISFRSRQPRQPIRQAVRKFSRLVLLLAPGCTPAQRQRNATEMGRSKYVSDRDNAFDGV